MSGPKGKENSGGDSLFPLPDVSSDTDHLNSKGKHKRKNRKSRDSPKGRVKMPVNVGEVWPSRPDDWLRRKDITGD
ncbi:hypothetical protein KBB48_03190 [Candidatus Shapirobacteria bacterium]|nr:hypothetical protein [Candidatus Shapirobacteria bacterium]